VDIRVSKPNARTRAPAPEERACDHLGCERAGAHRAPKARDRLGEFWWFCADHAAEYNRKWNFFAGMEPEELLAFEEAEWIGHRPTWAFKAGRGSREYAAFRGGRLRDRFGVFEGGREGAPEAPVRRIGRTQALALQVLNLEETADAAAVRNRYAELVKRYHPDSNGGDRTQEELLNRVLRAYQVLKQAGMA
jgi:hypothetical protein